MRKLIPFFVVLMAVVPVTSPALAGIEVGISATDEGLKSFYLAIGEHYRVPEKEVIVVRERRLPDDELPVVFFLAQRTGIEPGLIVDLRLGGMTWMDITLHYGLGPEIFYVPVTVNPGPPYGHAYGHFKKRPKDKWREIRLSDDDVVNFVNLRFISERYGCSPDKVIRMREKGDNFVAISQSVKATKSQRQRPSSAGPSKSSDNGKGKNKGSGKGKKK